MVMYVVYLTSEILYIVVNRVRNEGLFRDFKGLKASKIGRLRAFGEKKTLSETCRFFFR